MTAASRPAPAAPAVPAVPDVVEAPVWRARQRAHQRRVDAWLDSRVRRTDRGRRHIEDFLLTYYFYRSAQLRRWHPGPGVALVDADPAEFGPHHYRDQDGLVRIDVASVVAARRETIESIHRVLAATASRPAHLGCFNMHEWAMVYRLEQGQLRHAELPLRLGAQATAAVLEAQQVRCSHFDAFRFFTPPARPHNAWQLTRATQAAYEQPGCLHANMDLYRSAFKLAPLVPAELVADCFALARQIRTVDVRASPYDVRVIGLEPIAVETPAGRAEYVAWQRRFAAAATPLRSKLINYSQAALNGFG